MAKENKVLIRTTPTIKPTLIDYYDFESDKAKTDNKKIFDGTTTGFNQRKGLMEPVVMIGKVRLPIGKIKALTIWQDDLMPTMSLTFIDSGLIFTSRGFPVSNIVVSIFIQSIVKKLKSMAADFLINSISSLPIPNSKAVIYTISGELNVPIFNGNYSKSYRNMTSIQALQKVAGELGLGFADNQPEGMNDAMTWIMPNYTYRSFLKHLTKYSYHKEDDFFDFFVDRYYILNFINVEKQFSRDEEIDTGFLALDQTEIDHRRAEPGKESETDSIEIPLILSNHPATAATEFFITDFSMTSNHGEILKNHTIRKYAYWYDHGVTNGTNSSATGGNANTPFDKGFEVHWLEPLMSKTGKDGKIHQSPSIEDYKASDKQADAGPKVTSGVWSGIQYGNAHSKYKFAELINYHNWLETEKNILQVSLSGFNVNILRGSRIRVNIFLEQMTATAANVMGNDNGKNINTQNKLSGPGIDGVPGGLVKDEALSDFYYVSAMSYSYMNGKFQTNLSLSRRQWLPQAENKIEV